MFKPIRRIFENNISLRIIFSLGLTIAIILALFTYLLFQIQKKEILKRTESYNYIISRLIYQHIENAMLTGQKDTIEDVLRDLTKSPEVMGTHILDDKGIVKFSSEPRMLGQKIDVRDVMGSSVGLRPAMHGENFSMLTPIRNSEACHRCHGTGDTIGMLQINLSSSSMRKELAKNRNLMLFFGLTLLFAISAMIIILIVILLNKPLTILTEAMERVGRGDLSARVRIERNDNMGRLGEHFNSMIMSLEDTKGELEEFRKRHIMEIDKLASIGKIASGVAHEINNPLDSLQSCLVRVKKSLYDRKDVHEYLEWMRLSIHRIETVVKRLLDFAKPHQPILKPANISDIIDEVLSLIDYKAKKGSITIQKETQSNSLNVMGDKHLLNEVFFNLAINAIEAMPDGGTLRFKSYFDSNSTVYIEVEDTGTGIEKEQLDKVFEPFYTTKEEIGGTGLGLSICKDIIEQHKGTIEVKSSNGKGTTFLVRLPGV